LHTVEVVFEQYVKGRLRLTATGYHTRITNLIDQIDDEETSVRHQNEERARSRGIELEAERRWASGILVRGSYAGQQAIDCDGQTLTNAPHHLGTVQVMVPSWRRRVQVAADATYTSSRWTTGGTQLPGHWLTHLTTTYKPLTSRLTYGVSIQNLFDTTYSHPVGHEFVQDAIRQDGRTAVVTVGVRF
jgi:outer membrane receptor protein involved in Fe transport